MEKLMRDFSFLLNMIDSKYVQLSDEMKRHESETVSSIAELEEKIDAFSISERQYCESQEQSLNKIQDAACNIAKNLDKVISILNDGFSSVWNGISETQDKGKEGNDEVRKILQAVVGQVDSIRKETRNCIDSNNAIVENKTSDILSGVDEVKTLMKIVAVNNLIDEM